MISTLFSVLMVSVGLLVSLIALPFLLIGGIAILWGFLIGALIFFYGAVGLPFYVIRKVTRKIRRFRNQR
jgi:Flp pilus assembly protein TadB